MGFESEHIPTNYHDKAGHKFIKDTTRKHELKAFDGSQRATIGNLI